MLPSDIHVGGGCHPLQRLLMLFLLGGHFLACDPTSSPDQAVEQPTYRIPLLISWPGPGEGRYVAETSVFDIPGAIDTLLGNRFVTDSTLPVPFERVDQVLVLVLRGVSHASWAHLYQRERLDVVAPLVRGRSMHDIDTAWTIARQAEGGEAFWFNVAADRNAAVFALVSESERLADVEASENPLNIVILSQGGAAPFDDEDALLEVTTTMAAFLERLRHAGRLDAMAVIVTATHNLDHEHE